MLVSYALPVPTIPNLAGRPSSSPLDASSNLRKTSAKGNSWNRKGALETYPALKGEVFQENEFLGIQWSKKNQNDGSWCKEWVLESLWVFFSGSNFDQPIKISCSPSMGNKRSSPRLCFNCWQNDGKSEFVCLPQRSFSTKKGCVLSVCPCHFVSQDDISTWEIKFTSLVLSVVEQRIHGINLDEGPLFSSCWKNSRIVKKHIPKIFMCCLWYAEIKIIQLLVWSFSTTWALNTKSPYTDFTVPNWGSNKPTLTSARRAHGTWGFSQPKMKRLRFFASLLIPICEIFRSFSKKCIQIIQGAADFG